MPQAVGARQRNAPPIRAPTEMRGWEITRFTQQSSLWWRWEGRGGAGARSRVLSKRRGSHTPSARGGLATQPATSKTRKPRPTEERDSPKVTFAPSLNPLPRRGPNRWKPTGGRAQRWRARLQSHSACSRACSSPAGRGRSGQGMCLPRGSGPFPHHVVYKWKRRQPAFCKIQNHHDVLELSGHLP